ncbi:MAG: hypothetical protein ACK4MF_02200 [Hyphomicrobiaceae bacterium]
MTNRIHATRPSPKRAKAAAFTSSLATLAICGVAPAMALDILPNEKADREACARRACQIILKKDAAGPPLACNLTRTWDRDKIKKGGASKSISWGFGDARCSMMLKVERPLLVEPLTAPKYTLALPPQRIECQIEDDKKVAKPLVVVAAPKVKFKDGQAYKVWLNVKEVEGEGLAKNLVWSVSKLADGIGIFHSDTLKGINNFVHETCPTEHAGKSDGKAGTAPVKAKVP